MKERTKRLPVPLVADKLNTTSLNVLMHIRHGLLRAVEKEGTWLVDVRSLDELLARTGGGKAEAVCNSGCAKKHACGGGCS